mgnify:CR=1 FL=1
MTTDIREWLSALWPIVLVLGGVAYSRLKRLGDVHEARHHTTEKEIAKLCDGQKEIVAHLKAINGSVAEIPRLELEQAETRRHVDWVFGRLNRGIDQDG